MTPRWGLELQGQEGEMRNFRMWLFGWLAVALLSLEINALDQKQPMIGDPAPAFSLKTVDGKVVSLEQQRGKFVVLHFAASW